MARLSHEEYQERLRGIRLLVLDVDGVLTSGGIVFIDDDREAKILTHLDVGDRVARLHDEDHDDKRSTDNPVKPGSRSAENRCR